MRFTAAAIRDYDALRVSWKTGRQRHTTSTH